MLDQPVPNPLAKNPNFFTHKVFAAIGLILIGTIIAAAGIWWYANRSSGSTETDSSTTVKVTTTSAKPATASATKDETADWKTLTNKTIGYSVKYPSDWLVNGTASKPNCDDNVVFLAPTQELLGQCASGYGGLVSFYSYSTKDANAQIAAMNPSDYQDFSKTNVTVSEKTAVRVSGIYIKNNEMTGATGQKEIFYFIDLGKDKTLLVSHQQAKEPADYSTTFEKIVQTLKFN
ncbi:MAG TPA: hypothetical protein VLE47_01325 [Candidatus Saccharimonadales bacterium]|nr:hypothetical protein [Candidatus Saccharimonadales bacterium]